IWTMQPRFEKRTPASALSLVSQVRFRAGFDFLRLRANVGEVEPDIAEWWEAFSLADEATRHDLLQGLRATKAAPRKRAPRKGDASAGESTDDAPTPAAFDAASDEDAPPRKRRRRRRSKPSDGGDASGTSPNQGAGTEDND
ncbi:MAG: polynucleotide adenylyltransferase PcnB, partial [Burkholderiaceae bacterium]|nr:polynucleotide adenylyltransferase PcnB [Burkholderiaceae bacterium]